MGLGNAYENGLPRTLHPVQAEEERRRVGIIAVTRLMRLQMLEQERDAVLGLVIVVFWHFGGCRTSNCGDPCC